MLSSSILFIMIALGMSSNESEITLCRQSLPNNLSLGIGAGGWSSCNPLNQYLSSSGDLFGRICSHEQNFGLKCAKKFLKCGSSIALCIEENPLCKGENPLYVSQLKIYKRLRYRMAHWSSFKFNSTLAFVRRLRPPNGGDNGAFDALSNAWLRRHHRDAYKRIENSLKQRRINQATLSCIMVQLCRLLNSNNSNQGLRSSIQMIGRVKTIYSIWSKEQRIALTKEKNTVVMDQLAIKIVVDTIDDCYAVQNILTQKFKVSKTNNYILKPKSSGYQAIHIILFGLQEDQFIELQIVTHTINQVQMGDDHSQYKTMQDTFLYE